MLVVFGWGDDPQVARTLEAAKQQGAEFNLCDLADGADLTLVSQDPNPPKVIVNRLELSREDIIWDRSKFFPVCFFYFREEYEGETEHEKRRRNAMREAEWRAALKYLAHTGEYRYLNAYGARTEMAKPVQQRVAAGLGLRTPPTIVTTNHEQALSFGRAHQSLITKSLGAHRLLFHEQESRPPEVVMTMSCDADDIASSSAEAINALPHFFQKRIEKDYEVRVFAHKGECLAFRVDSQVTELTRVDWRYGSTFLNFSPCEMPSSVKIACQKFLKQFELFYGSFDFIVDPAGCWWFLECNQDGQWIWLDDACDGAITHSFATSLTKYLLRGEAA